MTTLLENYMTRPATLEDIPVVVALNNTCAMALIGKPHTDEDQYRNDWQQPTFNVETNTQMVLTPDGQLVGFAGLWDSVPHVKLYGWVDVHPAYHNRGIGTYLSAWLENRARQSVDKAPEGARVVLAQGKWEVDKVANAFLQAHNNYHETRYFLQMLIDLVAAPSVPVLPEGMVIRTFAVPAEAREQWLHAIIKADREAFRDHWGYVEHPYAEDFKEWKHWIDNDPLHDPSVWFLAMDGDEIVGLSLCQPKTPEDAAMAYVDTLCVRRAWRRKGIALALLQHTFGAFYRRGTRRVSLHVDASSLTGATRLYEKAGMHINRKSINYEWELRPGKDLSTQVLDERSEAAE